MPYEELQNWMEYFTRRPVGWRDDDRTMKLLQAQGVKAKPDQIFSSLAAIYNSNKATNDDEDGLNFVAFKNSAMFSKLLSASGGDKLEFNK